MTSVHSPQNCELQARCIFANHCLRIRVVGVPKDCDLGKWFEGCSGMLMISHGALQLRTERGVDKLGEGDSIALPLKEGTQLTPEKGADVIFFERRDHRTSKATT